MNHWWEIPKHQTSRNNQLWIANQKATRLAKQFQTPLFVYNANRIRENYRRLCEAFDATGAPYSIHYAMKANPHPAILALLRKLGARIDAVSPNEVRLAKQTGFSPEKIFFTGTSVSNDDLTELIASGVLINIDSFSQMRRLTEKKFDGNASIRWNPGTGAGIHDHTITGGKFIKFGIPEKFILKAFQTARTNGLCVVGLHQHIGSGWLGNDVQKFLKTVEKTISVGKKAEKILSKPLEFIDFGGGPGIRYQEKQTDFPIEKYAQGIANAMKKNSLNCPVVIEPGRFIVGDAGILLTEVNTVEIKNVPVIGVNAGFNALIRPAFYGAYHEIVNANRLHTPVKVASMVAGNLCESGDVFNTDKYSLRKLPKTREGDILAILNAGAYGRAMASNYNLRERPAEILIDEKKTRVITRKETFRQLIQNQKP